MRKLQFSEEQVLRILKDVEVGAMVAETWAG